MAEYDGYYHYLPVNDAAMRWGLYLTGAGSGCIGKGADYPPLDHPSLYDFQWARGRILPEFQLILITDGHGVFESEQTGEIAIEPGSVVFLFPGVWHRYRPDRDVGWKEQWISLNGELTHRLHELGLFGPESAVRRVRSPRSAASDFDRLLRRIHKDPVQNSILLSLEALALVGRIIENVADAANLPGGRRTVRHKNVSDRVVAEALETIWTHSHQALSIQSIAKRLSVSRRSLERRFQQEVGHTLLDEIMACRLSRAKRLLRETDLAVKAVAYLSGFPSSERMRVAFTQEEDVSPSGYRDRLLQQRKPSPERSARR